MFYKTLPAACLMLRCWRWSVIELVTCCVYSVLLDLHHFNHCDMNRRTETVQVNWPYTKALFNLLFQINLTVEDRKLSNVRWSSTDIFITHSYTGESDLCLIALCMFYLVLPQPLHYPDCVSVQTPLSWECDYIRPSETAAVAFLFKWPRRLCQHDAWMDVTSWTQDICALKGTSGLKRAVQHYGKKLVCVL